MDRAPDKSRALQKDPAKGSVWRNDRVLLVIIFFVALLFRLLYIHDISGQVFFDNLLIDQASYDEWAMRIVSGDWLGDKPFYQAPFYPYLLSIFYLIFGRDLVAVYIIQAAMSSACVFALYGIGRRSFNDARAGLLAALFWALYKVDFFFAAQILKTTPGISLVIFSLWLLFVFRDRPAISRAAAAGFFAGLTLVFRGNFLAVMPLLLVWVSVFLVQDKGRKASLPVALLLVCFAVVPAITAVRNYVVSDELVLTTAQGGINFYVGNYRGNEKGVGKDPEWALRVPRTEQEDFLEKARQMSGKDDFSPSKLSRFWFKQGLSEIKADPTASLKRLGWKALLIINRHEISDNLNYNFFRKHYSWILSLPLPAFWLAGSFGMAGLVLALYRRKGGLLALYFFAYAATVLAFYVVNRYRYPLAPPLLIFAAYGMVSAWDEARLKKWNIPAFFAVLVLAFAAAGAPTWGGESESLTFAKIGNAYFREQRFAEAIEAYEKALELDPDEKRALLGLGMAYEKRYRFAEAAGLYRKVIEMGPDNARPHYLLARTLEKMDRKTEAANHYQKALLLDTGLTPARTAVERLRHHRQE